MNGSAWDRFWHPPATLRGLALFRLAVAWLCLYDACLYDPTGLLAATGAEATWQPITVFAVVGLEPPAASTAALVATLYRLAAVAVLLGWRTRTCCLVLALLAFWQGGVFYSLTKVRHDRVALCFATFALAFAPSGGAFALDAFLRRRRGLPPPAAELAAWPRRLTQVTIAIGYSAAGLTKLLLVPSGWANGHTLQGIMLGHGQRTLPLVASVGACQLASLVVIAGEWLCPACLWWPQLVFVFLPLLFAFHLGTWATMDTGPYMTLWFLWIAFVPLDRVPAWLLSQRGPQRWRAALVATFGVVWLVVVATVMARVVPAQLAAAALAATALVAWLERRAG